MNDGKAFERDFISSVPDDWFKYRLNDSASSWQGGDKARFTPSNICDFIVYNGKMWMLELKSHKGKSIPLSCIRPKQAEGLEKAYLKNISAGFIFNFRDIEETYFVNASSVNAVIRYGEKKSLSLIWMKEKGVLIPQVKKRVRYGYILEFMEG